MKLIVETTQVPIHKRATCLLETREKEALAPARSVHGGVVIEGACTTGDGDGGGGDGDVGGKGYGGGDGNGGGDGGGGA